MDRTGQNETGLADTDHHHYPPSIANAVEANRWLRNAIIARSLEVVPRREKLEPSPIPGHTDLMWDDWKRLHGCSIDGYPDLRDVICRPELECFDSLDGLPEAKGGAYYVYFIRGMDLVKIGVSRKPRGRFFDLKIGSPVPLEFLFAWFVPEPYARGRNLENELHYRFRDCRVHGEWFRLSGGQISVCRDSLDGALEE
jgi:hypothetical protein